MNAREYDLLTAAPALSKKEAGKLKGAAPGAPARGVRTTRQLRAIARAPDLVRELYVAIAALPRTGPRRYDAAMFTTLAALALIAAQPAVLPALSEPGPSPEPNPTSDLPPPGCLQMLPPHAWCVEQQEAAKAFMDRCGPALALLPESAYAERRRWEALRREAWGSYVRWNAAARAQDPANSLTEQERRRWLDSLFLISGVDDFCAGRMPPPIPDGAPRD
jgi:hypothetical protein